jgi:2'-5' RNA ligase
MHRLFVGIRPPRDIRDTLLAEMEGVPGARWQDDAQLHITLRFIGAVERPVAEEIALTLGSVSADPFSLRLGGVGAFDRRGRTHALWAGVTPPERVAHLHRKIDQALVRLGLEPERRAYLPHVTLARLSAGAGMVAPWLADHGALTTPAFAVEEFLLYESHLGSGGASYEAIARYPLR